MERMKEEEAKMFGKYQGEKSEGVWVFPKGKNHKENNKNNKCVSLAWPDLGS